MLRRLAAGEGGDEALTGRVPRLLQALVIWGERVLALVIFVAVVAFTVSVVRGFGQVDWMGRDSFYEFVLNALLIGVGLELVRLLITHDLITVLELMAFVLARKVLKPDLGSWEILLTVVAFVTLLAARRYLTPQGQVRKPGAPSVEVAPPTSS